jgi:alkylation response protein AidB-like acyl-CoA dehydrogenase
MIHLTEDQELIVASAKDFCADPKTKALVAQAAAEKRLAREVWDEAATLGFVGLSTPAEYGGGGFTMVTEMLVIEEFVKAANPFASMLVAHNLGLKCLATCGTPEQKQAYLTKIATGECLVASAFTDPAGSFNYKEWGITFVPDGDTYVVNGTKVCVTQADGADIKFVFAMNHAEDPTIKGLIIEKSRPGVTSAPQTKLIPTTDGWGSLSFKDVRIPALNVVDTAGVDIPWLAPGFIEVGLSGFLTAQASFGLALQYSSQRTRYGKPLTNLQKVAHRLVDMAIKVESARSFIYEAAQAWDAGDYQRAGRLGLMAKIYGTEVGNAVAHDAVLAFGGAGYTADLPIGRLYANSVALEIAEGTNDILRDFIAETYGIAPGRKLGEI